MRKFVLFLICALILPLAGCAKKEEASALEKIQKKLIGLDSYSATALITQVSNKGEKTYEVSQDAKKSGEYRMVVTAPEKIAGTITIFDGSVTFQYNPRVDGSLKIDLPVSQLRNEILLTSFVKNYLNSEDVSVETMKQEGTQATVLEAVIPGTNPYMKTEKLWVDNKTLLPLKLVIFDEENSERIVVTYKKIEYNVKLGEDVFVIPENRAKSGEGETGETAETTETDETAENPVEEDAGEIGDAGEEE